IDHAEEARLSKKLVTLDDHVPLPCPIDDLAVRPLDAAKVTAFLQEQNFRSLLARLQPRLTGGAASPSADAETPAVHPSVALADAVRRYELVQDAATLDRWIDGARARRGGDPCRDQLARSRARRDPRHCAGACAGRGVLHPARPLRAGERGTRRWARPRRSLRPGAQANHPRGGA